jgi:hypothetical protein
MAREAPPAAGPLGVMQSFTTRQVETCEYISTITQ